MKKAKIILAIVFCLSAAFANAQRGMRMNDRKDKIESMKIGFLTERLNLTSEEAKKFWPVYNQYQNELGTLRKNQKAERRNAKDNFDSMSDKEVEKLVDSEVVFRQNELDLLKKYHVQFKQILPIKKVALLYRSEEAFKRELLNKLKDGGNRTDN